MTPTHATETRERDLTEMARGYLDEHFVLCRPWFALCVRGADCRCNRQVMALAALLEKVATTRAIPIAPPTQAAETMREAAAKCAEWRAPLIAAEIRALPLPVAPPAEGEVNLDELARLAIDVADRLITSENMYDQQQAEKWRNAAPALIAAAKRLREVEARAEHAEVDIAARASLIDEAEFAKRDERLREVEAERDEARNKAASEWIDATNLEMDNAILRSLLARAGKAATGMAQLLEHLRRSNRLADDDFASVSNWRDVTNALASDIRAAINEQELPGGAKPNGT